MSLDKQQCQEAPRITATQATKLVHSDGTAFIALEFTTDPMPVRFYTTAKDAEQLADTVIQALHSDGLKSLTS